MSEQQAKDIMRTQSKDKIPSDTLGSYTGTPVDEYDQPDQDADDL